MTDESPRRAYTCQTLAEEWSVSAATIRNLVRRGELKAFRVGRQIRIKFDEAEAYKLSTMSGPGIAPHY